MKVLLPLVLILAMFSCTRQNPADIAIKKRFCTNLIMQNESIMARMAEELKHNSRRAKYYGPQEKIDSLRRICLKRETTENLLMYADSVYKLFKDMGIQDKMIDDEMVRSKKDVASSGDSVAMLNLLFWSMTAELEVHKEALKVIAISCWIESSIPFYINDTTFHAGDTVMLAIELPYTSASWQPHFDDVTCINSKTKNSIKPKIYLTGPIAFFAYVPKEDGDYLIKGPVKISYNDHDTFESSFVIEQRFKVEVH